MGAEDQGWTTAKWKMVLAGDPRRSGILMAVGAALTFGLVNVVVKLGTLHPLVLGGGAYLLAGALMSPVLLRIRIAPADWPRILAMALVGGAVAPVLLFAGLQQTSAVAASLLLTLEMVFTAILAALFLRERAKGRAIAGLALLFAAALLASLTASGPGGSTALGALLVALATLGWGIDNTVSARLVGTYRPIQLVALKGLLGGGALALTALAMRAPIDAAPTNVGVLLFVGLLGVGASTALFYPALKRIGATRTTAVFVPATAVTGALGGWVILREPLQAFQLVALAFIVAGVGLVANERA